MHYQRDDLTVPQPSDWGTLAATELEIIEYETVFLFSSLNEE